MGATHGKLANVFSLRPGGFKGSGLNDVTWGTGFSGASSAYYEVVIDGTGTPDTFKWRKNGGAWTEGVNITGAAQTLDDGQQITFAATTGHTLGDQWVIGNLKDEACTESGATAQITDATKRMLSPNAPPTFTDTGGANVLRIDYAEGKAYFDASVTVVTVDGNNGYVPAGCLEKAGYLYNWEMNATVELSDITTFQSDWKSFLAGLAEAEGSADGFFAGAKWFECLEDCIDGTLAYFLCQLFTYDPDDDQTGDHFIAWVTFSGYSLSAPMTEPVKETINFKVTGMPDFVANS